MGDLKQREKDNLVKIAYWYYKRNMTQMEIAKRLGMTRQKINQIIGQLEDLRVVEIHINGLVDDYAELEYKLEMHFGLKQVSIVDADNTSRDYFKDFGRKAAEVIAALLEDGQTIGLSWGSTLGETIRYIKNKKLKKSRVVQLVGGLNSSSKLVRPDEITRYIATKLGCDFHILYAPALVDSAGTREMMLKENSIADTFAVIQKCDIAILGVGELNQESTITKEGFMPKERVEALIRQGGVGDIAMHPYTREGVWLPNDNLIGIDCETLHSIPNVVILACGSKKAEAVTGAILTGCVNTVVIDKEMAKVIAKKQKL